MTQEEKQLLFRDLCARLPYSVIVQQSAKYPKGHIMYNVADKWDTEPHDFKIIGVEGTNTLITDKRKEERTYAKGIVSSPITIRIHNGLTGQVVKPYLRLKSSMTEEESKEFALLQTDYVNGFLYPIAAINMVNWLNEHYFDYHGLIEKGLALEAPEGMYKL